MRAALHADQHKPCKCKTKYPLVNLHLNVLNILVFFGNDDVANVFQLSPEAT